jgi:uncharacterized cupredoxin-like copper-binding protein
MDTPLAANPTAARLAARRPLSALTKWTAATLGAFVVMLWLQVAIAGGFFLVLALAFGTPTLVIAALIIATRWRWVPLLGAIFWMLIIVANLGVIPYDITHPEAYNTFAFTVIVLGLAVAGIVAGIGATLQNYRAPATSETDTGRQRLPRGFPTMLWALAALCLGALLVGAIPRTSAAAGSIGVSREALAALPGLGMAQFKFDQQELRVTAGELAALRLDNRDDREHSFDIDELEVHVPVAIGQSGVALFMPDQPGTYAFYCNIPGHREAGMAGTLVVEP